MTRFDYKTFYERYDKFKRNNLPTPFWDRERQVLEYVFYDKDYCNNGYNVSNSLVDSFSNKLSFYYSFSSITITKDGNKKIGHRHAHTFEEVVRDLYDYPVSFSIPKKDEVYYSKQELSYLKILKNYLLLINLNDVEDTIRISRYRNKLVKKYQNAIILQVDNRVINNIIKGKCVFFAVKKSKYNIELKKYKKGELQYLVIDNKYNFRLLIEYVEKKKQKYKEVKKQVKVSGAKDNDEVIVSYFKVLEVFQQKRS